MTDDAFVGLSIAKREQQLSLSRIAWRRRLPSNGSSERRRWKVLQRRKHRQFAVEPLLDRDDLHLRQIAMNPRSLPKRLRCALLEWADVGR
jgi:hypothetical protein